MNAQQIKQVMAEKGIAGDPVWRSANFYIHRISCFSEDDCPLGLYFPVAEYVAQFRGVVPAHTIVLPPNSNQSVLLHELGHHYGNIYHHDVTEEFARAYARFYSGLPYTVAACGGQGCCCQLCTKK